MAWMTLPTCSHNSIPNSCAACSISAREVPAAKALSFHFFLTDEGSRSYNEREGRTSADTIYAIDKVADDALFGWFEANWPDVELVSEGRV